MAGLHSPLLITGGCGFIGSAVVRRLRANFPSKTLIVLDRLDACASLKNLPENTVTLSTPPSPTLSARCDGSDDAPPAKKTGEENGGGFSSVVVVSSASPLARSDCTERHDRERGGETSELASGVYFVRGDVCEVGLVEALLREHRVRTVLHFAAQTHVDNSFETALDFTRSNVLGTHAVLEAARVSPRRWIGRS
jgi:nucleoside-diphosphate-sugar epimerase